MVADVDVLIVGGGINGLTAAAYLARSGRSVLIVEQAATCGGVASGTQPFAGIDVGVSPFAAGTAAAEERVGAAILALSEVPGEIAAGRRGDRLRLR